MRYLQDALNLSITLGINKVVTLSFEGTFVVKASLFLQWTDPLSRWMRDTPYNWRFPEWIILPANEVWHPRYVWATSRGPVELFYIDFLRDESLRVQLSTSFLLANCETELCVIGPENDSRVILDNDGQVISFMEVLLTSSCNLNLDEFPFDEQTYMLISCYFLGQ